MFVYFLCQPKSVLLISYIVYATNTLPTTITAATYMYETVTFLLSFLHVCIRNHPNIEYDSRLHHNVRHLL